MKVGTSIKLSERGALKSIEGLACQTVSFLLNSLFFIMLSHVSWPVNSSGEFRAGFTSKAKVDAGLGTPQVRIDSAVPARRSHHCPESFCINYSCTFAGVQCKQRLFPAGRSLNCILGVCMLASFLYFLKGHVREITEHSASSYFPFLAHTDSCALVFCQVQKMCSRDAPCRNPFLVALCSSRLRLFSRKCFSLRAMGFSNCCNMLLKSVDA